MTSHTNYKEEKRYINICYYYYYYYNLILFITKIGPVYISQPGVFAASSFLYSGNKRNIFEFRRKKKKNYFVI